MQRRDGELSQVITTSIASLIQVLEKKNEGGNVLETALEQLQKNFDNYLDEENLVEASMIFENEKLARLFVGWRGNMAAQRAFLKKKGIKFEDES
jgi:hypothetical protein